MGKGGVCRCKSRSTTCPHSQAPLACRLEEARSRHLGEIIGNGVPCSKLPKKTRPRIFHPASPLDLCFPLCFLQPSRLTFPAYPPCHPTPLFLCGEGDTDQRKRQGETGYNSPGACTHVTRHSDTDAKRAQGDTTITTTTTTPTTTTAMDNCHAIYTESPFAISQEDVDALNSSKAFCALRRCLAGQAEYVLSCPVLFCCSLVRVRELIAPGLSHACCSSTTAVSMLPNPTQPSSTYLSAYLTIASICKVHRLMDPIVSVPHIRHAHPKPSKHGCSTAISSTPLSCPLLPCSRVPRP